MYGSTLCIDNVWLCQLAYMNWVSTSFNRCTIPIWPFARENHQLQCNDPSSSVSILAILSIPKPYLRVNGKYKVGLVSFCSSHHDLTGFVFIDPLSSITLLYSSQCSLHMDNLSLAGKHLGPSIPICSNIYQKLHSTVSVSWQPNPSCGPEHMSRLCAKLLIHFLVCPELPPLRLTQQSTKLHLPSHP